MNRIKGILYAAVSSSTFGLAPFFSITLLLAGFSAFEVLSYRWGVAAIVLTLFGWCSGCNFRLAKKDLLVVFLLYFVRYNFVQNKKVSIFMLSIHKKDAYYKIYR